MTELIGANLAALLKERGMSQKELAEAAGLTPASVSRYVNGEREPWPATIAALSLALGVEPSDCGRFPGPSRGPSQRGAELGRRAAAELIAALAKR